MQLHQEKKCYDRYEQLANDALDAVVQLRSYVSSLLKKNTIGKQQVTCVVFDKGLNCEVSKTFSNLPENQIHQQLENKNTLLEFLLPIYIDQVVNHSIIPNKRLKEFANNIIQEWQFKFVNTLIPRYEVNKQGGISKWKSPKLIYTVTNMANTNQQTWKDIKKKLLLQFLTDDFVIHVSKELTTVIKNQPAIKYMQGSEAKVVSGTEFLIQIDENKVQQLKTMVQPFLKEKYYKNIDSAKPIVLLSDLESFAHELITEGTVALTWQVQANPVTDEDGTIVSWNQPTLTYYINNLIDKHYCQWEVFELICNYRTLLKDSYFYLLPTDIMMEYIYLYFTSPCFFIPKQLVLLPRASDRHSKHLLYQSAHSYVQENCYSNELPYIDYATKQLVLTVLNKIQQRREQDFNENESATVMTYLKKSMSMIYKSNKTSDGRAQLKINTEALCRQLTQLFKFDESIFREAIPAGETSHSHKLQK